MKANIIKITIFIMLFSALLIANPFTQVNKSHYKVNVDDIIPVSFNGWHGDDLPIDKTIYTRIFPNELVIRKYQNPTIHKDIYLTVVLSPERSHIHDPLICYKLQGFKFIKFEKSLLKDDMPVTIANTLKDNKNYTFLYWYTNLQKDFDNRTDFFKDYFFSKLENRNSISGLIILYSQDCDKKTIKEFAIKINNVIKQNKI